MTALALDPVVLSPARNRVPHLTASDDSQAAPALLALMAEPEAAPADEQLMTGKLAPAPGILAPGTPIPSVA